MKLSAFGRKFTADAGITSLMDDLGNAMASGEDMIMMGGAGNKETMRSCIVDLPHPTRPT